MVGRFDDWEKDDDGHLKVWPVLAFTTALFGAEKVGLRIEIGTQQPKPGEPVPALQLVLDPSQVRQLADALAEAEARLADARFTSIATSGPGNA